MTTPESSSLDPKANLSGYTRCTMLETLAISLSRANMTLRSWGHGEPERRSDFQCETQNEVFSMTEAQIEEAERLLSYYECHGAIHNWGADAAALLRDLLPDWSAFKEAIDK